jgi:hypothetical protein
VGPIVLTEAVAVADWARTIPVGLFAILRAPDLPLGLDADALAGLDVLVVTYRPFAEWRPICGELVAVGVRFLQLIDRRRCQRSQVVVSNLPPAPSEAHPGNLGLDGALAA